MILIYTDHGEVPKEILTDMKKHNLVVKNQLVYVSIPLVPEREQEEIENFGSMFKDNYELQQHLTPSGKVYFTVN